ncbi:hypothetical protein PIB30_031946 [Stylosanthes scabra]|uniref:Uncharacterized protein n=1 Tax=Stylosanthes scabra TaxID=79078 RepID=A0ABU6RCB7_9FABA|nr:hypothetical protein [Stylosanthes scabra]
MPRKLRFNLPTTMDTVADVKTGGNMLEQWKGGPNPQVNIHGNEARPAKSARVIVLKVPTPRECSTHRADLDDTSSEDEDYIPEVDVDESSEESLGNLSEREEVGRSGKETRRKQRDVWHVQVIENGVEREETITGKEVFSLPAVRIVVLTFDTMHKPVG